MKRVSKSIICLCLVIMVLASIGVTAYAASDEETVEAFVKSYVTVDTGGSNVETDYVIQCVRLPAIKSYLYAYQPSDGEIYTPIAGVSTNDGSHTVIYYRKSQVKSIASAIERYYSNEKVSQKVNDLTSGFNIQADTESASKILSGFESIISLALGIITIVIILGTTVFTGFDIIYIAWPLFREKCEDAKVSGKKGMTKRDRNGNTQLRWVTDDAQYAVRHGVLEEGQNPWILYLQKRVVTIVMLGVLLYILLSGNISVIVQLAIKVTKGIMDVLGNLAS